MFYLRQADKRGRTQTDWLDSRHTFSFGQYYDPRFMAFSDLRVINDDVVAPSGGFGTHPHDNMEIVSVVFSGRLEHKDSLGSGSVITPGEVQAMTAGTGIHHSEFNPSAEESVHFLQIWIMPDMQGLEPSYRQQKFAPEKMKDRWCLIVSSDGAEESLKIYQDAKIFQTRLSAGAVLEYSVGEKRAVWIQVVSGSVDVSGNLLVGGDGLAVYEEERPLVVKGLDEVSNLLLFDLRG